MSDVRRDFIRRDREAATIFGETARIAGVDRIVYLGGLGEDGSGLSPHLASRHEVGSLRRSATALRVGDAVDFWRVEAYEPDRLLRLRAEMRLPEAWLEFETTRRDDGKTSLRQTAFFDPRGAFGFCYWYVALPFHEFIFATWHRESSSSRKPKRGNDSCSRRFPRKHDRFH